MLKVITLIENLDLMTDRKSLDAFQKSLQSCWRC